MRIWVVCILSMALVVISLAQDYEADIKQFRAELAANPDDVSALYDLGLACYLTDNAKEAIVHWERLKKLEDKNWQLRAKLVQAYDKIGDKQKRDAEINELYALRNGLTIPELTKAEFFCRDQFQAEKQKIMVFEYFDFVGERPIIYKFFLLDDKGDIIETISLGSYEMTTNVARELGSIKPDERVYHLDRYRGDGSHQTLQMYHHRPNYDSTKEMVQKALKKDFKPISGTYPSKKK